MAGGAGAHEYAKELLVLLDDALLLFRLPCERNAHDLVFGKQTILLVTSQTVMSAWLLSAAYRVGGRSARHGIPSPVAY